MTDNGCSSVPAELQALCPKTNQNLLLCSHCVVLPTTWRVDRRYEWGRVLYCSCGKDWVVCGFCTSATRFISVREITAHNRNCHSKKRVLSPLGKKGRLKRGDDDLSSEDDDDPVIMQEEDNVPWIANHKSPLKEKKEDSLLVVMQPSATSRSQRELFGEDIAISGAMSTLSLRDFGNEKSTTYFNNDINGSGVAAMVAMSQFGCTSEIGKLLHPLDIQYTADLGTFLHGLTQSQRADLAHIIKATTDKVRRDERRSKQIWKTNVPPSPTDMRRAYWQGKKSFLGSVPHPTVEGIGQHAYVSIRECIRHRLAFGFPLEKLEDRGWPPDSSKMVRTLMQSAVSQRVINECKFSYGDLNSRNCKAGDGSVLILLLKEWQDGYDPHSFSKANRGSCWVKLVTIAEPHDNRNGTEVSESARTFILYCDDGPNFCS